MQPLGLLRPSPNPTFPGSDAAAKRFVPNLAASRHKILNKELERMCEDGSTFREKNQDFYFSKEKEAEDARKRPREDPVASEAPRKTSSIEDSSNPKNADYYFSNSEQLSDRFTHFSLGETLEEEPYIDQAIAFAMRHGGECLSMACSSRSHPLVYKCKLGHCFESCGPLLHGTWCLKCIKKIQSAKTYASSMGGSLASESADITLEFQCGKGHRFCYAAKKYKQKWCPTCRAEERKQRKEELREEQDRVRIAQEREQQRLFDEARRSCPVPPSPILSTESQIDHSASQLATSFLSTAPESLSYPQVFNVYKVMCSTEDFLAAKYFSPLLSKGEITVAFRKLAKALHPDKNRHPQASEAFLKVMKIYTKEATRR